MGKKFSIITFGCQMNVRDSEIMRSVLLKEGYEEDTPEEADIIVINSCSVRAKAERKAKVYARDYKRKGKKVIFAGCVAETEKEKVLDLGVDGVLGTRKIFDIDKVIKKIENEPNVVETGFTDIEEPGFIAESTHPVSSYVTISLGCDNFCSFCIVPHTRGREEARRAESILYEAKELLKKGAKEIILLGQNVNSYFDYSNGFDFADLLYYLEENLKGNYWLKYISPNPRDFSYKLLNVIRNSQHISHWFHLPLQSGSNNILKRMRREYTKEEFLDLCYTIREEFPDAVITTDIIVGFPGEKEKDFYHTLDVVEKVKFDMAFMFKYSERPKTPARFYKDKVREEDKEERLQILIKKVNEKILESRMKMLGRRFVILVDGKSEKFENFSSCKTRENIKGVIKGIYPKGSFIVGRVKEIKGHTPLFEFERFCDYKGGG